MLCGLNHQRLCCRAFVSAAFLASVVALPAFAQRVMTVSDVADYALRHNREIKTAQSNVSAARETISEVFSLDKSSLSISGGYNYTKAKTTELAETRQDAQQEAQVPKEHTVNVDGSVTIPIIPQLSISAGIGDTLFDDKDNTQASLRLNFNPFNDTSANWKDWETLRKAEIQLDNLKISVPMNAEAAALAMVKGQLDLESAERAMRLAQSEYEIYLKRYELEDITYVELEDSRIKASTTRQAYYNSQKSLLSLKKNLYQIIGPDLGEVELSSLAVDDVSKLVDAREADLQAAAAGGAVTVDLLNQAVELEALRRKLKATPLFKPSLSLSGNMSLFDFRAGASLSISFSPDQFQTKERAEIEAAIADKELDLALAQAYVDLEVRMLTQSVSFAREALQISLSDYESSQIQYRETELLHQRGERTALELEQSGLSVFSSSIRLFSSAVELYRNLGDLLKLYLLD